ncbi:MAG: folate family ECF transporter S component [Eubacteriales bacterium]|jgi:ECF transporter S component (folate family)
MRKIWESFRLSAAELHNVRSLASVAVLIAVNLALSKVNVYITPEERVSVSFLATACIGMLFGPVMGMSAGFVCDIVSFISNPQPAPYFPGYTITAMMGGLLYGLCLYRRELTTWRAFAAVISVSLICNICLNSLWSSILYAKAIYLLLPVKIIKNLLLLPFKALLLYTVCSQVQTLYQRVRARL